MDIHLYLKTNEFDFYCIDEHFFYILTYLIVKPDRIRLTFKLFETDKKVSEGTRNSDVITYF